MCLPGEDNSVLGERLRIGEDSSRRGERLRLGEQLSLLGEKALGEPFQPCLENSALLLPGEAARLLGQTPLGAGSGPGPGSGSGVHCCERFAQLERPPIDG